MTGVKDKLADTVSALIANAAAILPGGNPRPKRQKTSRTRCPHCELFWHSCPCPQK